MTTKDDNKSAIDEILKNSDSYNAINEADKKGVKAALITAIHGGLIEVKQDGERQGIGFKQVMTGEIKKDIEQPKPETDENKKIHSFANAVIREISAHKNGPVILAQLKEAVDAVPKSQTVGANKSAGEKAKLFFKQKATAIGRGIKALPGKIQKLPGKARDFRNRHNEKGR